MNHHDAEITDVVVVLDGQGAKALDSAVDSLKKLGLEVSTVNNDEGVIEGSIDTSKVNDLKAVPGVCYVRSVFTYTADFPTGDPRDQDGPPATMETDDQ
jgi:hypothetical protein